MAMGVRITLAAIALVGTVSFAVIGLTLGHELPNGAGPFYILSLICGVGLYLCLSPRFHQKPEVPVPKPVILNPESQSIRDVDLTTLTASGWALLLSTFALVVALFLVTAHMLPNDVEEQLPEGVGQRKFAKVVALIGFGIVCGYFVTGRYLLKKLGYPILPSKNTTERELGTPDARTWLSDSADRDYEIRGSAIDASTTRKAGAARTDVPDPEVAAEPRISREMSPSSAYFQSLIVAARERFDQGRDELVQQSRSQGRGRWNLGPKDLRHQFVTHYEELLRKGTVVWAALVQANANLFHPGDGDTPCLVMYGLQQYFDAHPEVLCNAASAVYALKGTIPDDPELRDTATAVSDEYSIVLRQPLPEQLAGPRPLYLSYLMVHRDRLPNGVLSDRVFPLVVADSQVTRVVMLLPRSCWPSELAEGWGTLARSLEQSGRITLKSQMLADRRVAPISGVPRLSQAFAEARKSIIALTPEAANAIREVMRLNRIPKSSVLRVGAQQQPEGIEHSFGFDEQSYSDDLRVESCGLTIVLRRHLVPLLQDTVIDFRDSELHRGFLFHRPDDFG